MNTERRTILDILGMKGKEKIAALTAYDVQFASILDEAGLDLLLVGDSAGNVVHGHPDTLSVTMDDMIRHTQAVLRGSKKALVVGDMPFGSYQPSVETAVKNAVRFLAEGGQLAGAQPVSAGVLAAGALLTPRMTAVVRGVLAHL